MTKVLRVFKVIFLLAWLVFLVLCCHSCLMASSGSAVPAGADSVAPAPQAVQPSVDANSVLLSSGTYPKETESLTAVVTAEDLPLLDSFTALRTADFSGSTCYPELLNWAEAHPDVAVKYTVTLPDGQVLASDAESVELSGMTPGTAAETARLLSFLKNVKSVNLGTSQAGNVLSTAELAAFAEACPNAALDYSLSFLGQELKLTDTELDFSSLTSGNVAEAVSVLQCMNQVSLIHLDSSLSWDDISQIHTAAPTAVLDYPFSLLGVDANLSDTDLSFSHISMNDEGAAVRSILPYMVNLQTLDMDTCGVSNESMAAIRDAYPNVNVIWRVWFAGYTARTDVERILASSTARGGEITDAEAKNLQYCTKVKYLDVGHNNVLSDISFAASMPDLEVAIFAINEISDISPLANCPKLEYLEINSTNVTDLSPLANATALRHLNIGRCVQMIDNTGDDLDRPRVTDISPLFGLTELQRLYIGSLTAPGIPAEQLETMAKAMGLEKKDNEGNYCEPRVSPEGLPYDYIRINVSAGDPSQGTWRTAGYRPNWVWDQWQTTGVFNDPLDDRYKLLREQFGYDTADQSYALPKNDPLY